jgi:hypothetical protein
MWVSHQLLSPELFQVSKTPAMVHFSWTCVVIIPQASWIMLICLFSSQILGHKKLNAESQYKTSNISNTCIVYHKFKKIKFLSQVLAQRWMTTVVNLMIDDRWIWNICKKCVCVCVCTCMHACVCLWHGISPKTDHTLATPAYHHHHHKTYIIPHIPLADMTAEQSSELHPHTSLQTQKHYHIHCSEHHTATHHKHMISYHIMSESHITRGCTPPSEHRSDIFLWTSLPL